MNVLIRDWEMPPTEKAQPCNIVLGTTLLALVGFASMLSLAAGTEYYLQNGDSELASLPAKAISLITLFTCFIPINICKMRDTKLVFFTVFFSTLCGWWALYSILKPTLSKMNFEFLLEIDPITRYIIYALPFIHSGMIATLAKIRANEFYSEKSGRWLRSYSVAHGFFFNEKQLSFDMLTFPGIMNSEWSRKRWKKGVCHMIMFLDAMPDGYHVLGVELRRNVRFFSLSSSNDPLRRKAFVINREQAELIAEKFGPVKKTFLCNDMRWNRSSPIVSATSAAV